MIRFVRWLLLPMSLLYALSVWLRNLGYDYGVLSTKKYPIRSIVIGNLAIGGTGKTPMTEYLIGILRDHFRIATLSRGYGRKTKGFRYVHTNDQATESGDEPLQLKRKFPTLTVAVAEDRRVGVEQLLSDHDLILLDDAYQHRRVTATCNILLFDYESLLKPMWPLPTGNFRDGLPQARRAHLIVITKTPENANQEDRSRMIQRLKKHSSGSIFFSGIRYGMPQQLMQQASANQSSWLSHEALLTPNAEKPPKTVPEKSPFSQKHVLLVTGIANPAPLKKYVEKHALSVTSLTFPDHHAFTEADYEKIRSVYQRVASQGDTLLLTTEKDTQRLSLDLLDTIPSYFLPISFFMEEDEAFQQALINTLESSFVNKH